jgi:hypothetical protein
LAGSRALLGAPWLAGPPAALVLILLVDQFEGYSRFAATAGGRNGRT